MRSGVLLGSLARLTVVALLIASGRAECQQSDNEAPGADLVRDGCPSVVLVQCAQPQAQGGQVEASEGSREATHRRLQARRLRQMQVQSGLTAIEITGERPAQVQSDAWENFRQSVSSAAVPDCLNRDTFPPEQWGLLRPLILVGAAATGKCR